MAMTLRCDTCYKELNALDQMSYTTFVFAPADEYKSTKSPKYTITMHFCNPCLTKDKKLNFYVDNPFYKPPKEE
jgi:hypothetical protein